MAGRESVGAAGSGSGHSVRCCTDDAEGTRAVAATLAAYLNAGDVILLTGGLAVGKTTFVSGAVAALGGDEPVTSPTFALAQFYQSARIPVLHVDTYRLADVAEFRDLGLDEYLEDAVALIEWGGLVGAEFVDPLWVDLALHPDVPDTRAITFASSSPRWEGVLERLGSDPSQVGE